MRLPNLSAAVVRHPSTPAGPGRGRVQAQVKVCGDTCDGLTDDTCPTSPINCPCKEQSNGTYKCQV